MFGQQRALIHQKIRARCLIEIILLQGLSKLYETNSEPNQRTVPYLLSNAPFHHRASHSATGISSVSCRKGYNPTPNIGIIGICSW